jgi:probable HAF family extracellular repeat protein
MNSVGWLGMAFEAGSFSARAKERRMQTQQPMVRPRGALSRGLSRVRRASEFNRTPAAPTSVARDFAALRSACDAQTSACGVRLWRLARQIADFAANHHMSGSEMARGLGRSRGYVSRALKAARLPEPVTDEGAQHVFDVFHGVSGGARGIKDSAAALRQVRTWSRVAVRRGASPAAVTRAAEEAAANVMLAPSGADDVSIGRNSSLADGLQNVSIGRNTMGTAMAMLLAVALCWGGWAAPAWAQCQYQVTVVPAPGCFGAAGDPMAINNRGDVLISRNNCGEPILHDSFLWTAESGIQQVHPPPGFHGAHAQDLNDLREIVGYVQQQISGPKGTLTIEQACLWRPGETVLLGIPTGGNFSIANAINNKSEVCGYWGNTVTGPHRAFIWRDGVMTDLTLPLGPQAIAEAINDFSQITGWMGDAPQSSHCFLWSESAVIDLGPVPGGGGGRGVAVGRNGLVSGWGTIQPSGGGPSQARSSQWRNGRAIDLGMLPNGQHMRARGGNNFATVGYCDRPTEFGDRGFLYQNGALIDLSDLVVRRVIGFAQDVNNAGQILAEGTRDGGPTQVTLLSPFAQPEGDVSHDCRVDSEDLLAVISEWGSANSFADTNDDGVVDVDDLITVILHWGA